MPVDGGNLLACCCSCERIIFICFWEPPARLEGASASSRQHYLELKTRCHKQVVRCQRAIHDVLRTAVILLCLHSSATSQEIISCIMLNPKVLFPDIYVIDASHVYFAWRRQNYDVFSEVRSRPYLPQGPAGLSYYRESFRHHTYVELHISAGTYNIITILH
jgi:hypothetical protein